MQSIGDLKPDNRETRGKIIGREVTLEKVEKKIIESRKSIEMARVALHHFYRSLCSQTPPFVSFDLNLEKKLDGESV
jgi:hypothetical protein